MTAPLPGQVVDADRVQLSPHGLGVGTPGKSHQGGGGQLHEIWLFHELTLYTRNWTVSILDDLRNGALHKSRGDSSAGR